MVLRRNQRSLPLAVSWSYILLLLRLCLLCNAELLTPQESSKKILLPTVALRGLLSSISEGPTPKKTLITIIKEEPGDDFGLPSNNGTSSSSSSSLSSSTAKTSNSSATTVNPYWQTSRDVTTSAPTTSAPVTTTTTEITETTETERTTPEPSAAATITLSGWEFPSHVTLRGGVLHAPPFATVEEQGDGSFVYGGFQIDLLERMKIFASDINVTLSFQFSPSPPMYGDAFDLVANDCNTSANENPLEDCNKFDFIVANFYATPERTLRAKLSPPWLRSTISTIKYLDKTSPDYTTLAQASDARADVCLKNGTFYAGLVKEKFPNCNFVSCPDLDGCLQALKEEQCVLYADDELQLRFRQAWDPTLEVTREQFNTQYIVWPFKYDLSQEIVLLMEKLIRDSITNATMDELYFKYFQKALCPVGTAGDSCELPCDPNHGAANSRGVCVCESTKWTGDDCSVEVPEELNLIPSTMVIIAYTMLGINCLVITLCAGWLFWQRNSIQVRFSQPFFLVLVLVGCLISSSTIIVLAQEDEGGGPVHACMAIPWLYSVGFSVTFGTLFAKIRRVYFIFLNAAKKRAGSENRNSIISVQETLAVIGGVLLVDVIILLVWTIVDPLKWERVVISADQFGLALESEGKCVSQHWLAFGGAIAALHLLLMGTACWMCYVARNIPTRFSEGKYVSIAMISNLQIFIVGVPILIIIGSDPQTSFFVRCTIIWMNDLAVVVLLFGNLIYKVHFKPDDENGENARAAIGNAVERFASTRGVSRATIANRAGSSSLVKMPTIASEGNSECNRSEEAPIQDFSKPRDVLAANKDSWGNVNVSMWVREDNNHYKELGANTSTASSDNEEENEEQAPLGPMKTFSKPVDVLADNKASWGGGTLSILMKDDSNSHHEGSTNQS